MWAPYPLSTTLPCAGVTSTPCSRLTDHSTVTEHASAHSVTKMKTINKLSCKSALYMHKRSHTWWGCQSPGKPTCRSCHAFKHNYSSFPSRLNCSCKSLAMDYSIMLIVQRSIISQKSTESEHFCKSGNDEGCMNDISVWWEIFWYRRWISLMVQGWGWRWGQEKKGMRRSVPPELVHEQIFSLWQCDVPHPQAAAPTFAWETL